MLVHSHLNICHQGLKHRHHGGTFLSGQCDVTSLAHRHRGTIPAILLSAFILHFDTTALGYSLCTINYPNPDTIVTFTPPVSSSSHPLSAPSSTSQATGFTQASQVHKQGNRA